jgi:hypothetical protein
MPPPRFGTRLCSRHLGGHGIRLWTAWLAAENKLALCFMAWNILYFIDAAAVMKPDPEAGVNTDRLPQISSGNCILYHEPRTRMGCAAVQGDEMSGGERDIGNCGGNRRRTVHARCSGIIFAEDGGSMAHTQRASMSKLHPFSMSRHEGYDGYMQYIGPPHYVTPEIACH